LFVLKGDFAAGAGFQADEEATDVSFGDAEYKGLGVALAVVVADGEEVFAGFGEEEERGNEDGADVAAVDFLTVFEGVDAFVGDLDGFRFCFEAEGGGVGGDEAAIGLVSEDG